MGLCREQGVYVPISCHIPRVHKACKINRQISPLHAWNSTKTHTLHLIYLFRLLVFLWQMFETMDIICNSCAYSRSTRIINVNRRQQGHAVHNSWFLLTALCTSFPLIPNPSVGMAHPHSRLCGEFQFNPGHVNKSNEQACWYYFGTERCKHADLHCF